LFWTLLRRVCGANLFEFNGIYFIDQANYYPENFTPIGHC
jgi:hypothetical protein